MPFYLSVYSDKLFEKIKYLGLARFNFLRNKEFGHVRFSTQAISARSHMASKMLQSPISVISVITNQITYICCYQQEMYIDVRR